jgi:hypothetical protein
MSITLPDARQLPDEILEALRLRALNGREPGFTEADLANLLGVSRETVCRWWSAYAAHGLDALPHERTGRPGAPSAPAGSSPTSRPAASNDSWTRRAPETWASPRRCGTAAPSST